MFPIKVPVEGLDGHSRTGPCCSGVSVLSSWPHPKGNWVGVQSSHNAPHPKGTWVGAMVGLLTTLLLKPPAWGIAWAALTHRGHILHNLSIPALSERAGWGCTFSLVPNKESLSTAMREMSGYHMCTPPREQHYPYGSSSSGHVQLGQVTWGHYRG